MAEQRPIPSLLPSQNHYLESDRLGLMKPDDILSFISLSDCSIHQNIAFKINILGALSVGDGRTKAYPLSAAFPKSLS